MPNAEDIRFYVGNALDTGRPDLARPWRDSLLGDGTDPANLTLLARLTADEGDIVAAMAYNGEAVRANPFYIDGQIQRGNALLKLEAYDQAIECFEQILLFSPLHDQALAALIHAAQKTGRSHVAAYALQRRLRLGAEHAELQNTLGLCLHSCGNLQGALEAYLRAIELDPNTPLYYSNSATIFYHLERFDDALTQLECALQLDPDFATAWYHIGNVRKATCKIALAEEAYRRAVKLKPDYAEAHFALGCALLQQDAWLEGWSEYEWRWRVPGLVAPIHAHLPLWQGEDLQGKRLLVVAEQGSGDTLQYIRYARELAARGATVVVWAPPETASLLNRLPYIAQAASNRFELPQCDMYIPTMSVPRLLQSRFEQIPAEPYLSCDPVRLARFARELGPRQEKLRIGIAWAGNSGQVADRYRSAHLAALAPLFGDPMIRWISLQKGSASQQIAQTGLPLEDWGSQLESFDATAALMSALDGVVSVCSAPIHLAGGLGVRSVAMLSWAPDWRWRADTVHTPYYPAMRIARMSSLNNWDEVARRTAEIVSSWKPKTRHRS